MTESKYIDVPQPKYETGKRKHPTTATKQSSTKQCVTPPFCHSFPLHTISILTYCRVSRRIQHQYFGVEDLPDEDCDIRSPFQVCGVMEGVWMYEPRAVSVLPPMLQLLFFY